MRISRLSSLVPLVLAALTSSSTAFAFDLHGALVPSTAGSLARGSADCTVAESGLGGSPMRRVSCTLQHIQLSGAPTSAGLFRTGFPASTLALVPCDVSVSPITCTGDVGAATNTYSYLQNGQMSVGIATAAFPASPGELSGALARVVDAGNPDAGPSDGGPDGSLPPEVDAGLDAGSPDGAAPPPPARNDASTPASDASTPSIPDASAGDADGGAGAGDDAAGASCSASPGATELSPVFGLALAIGAVVAWRRRRANRG